MSDSQQTLPLSQRFLYACSAALFASVLYHAGADFARHQKEPIDIPLDHAIPFIPETVWIYLPGYVSVFLLCTYAVRNRRSFQGILLGIFAMQVTAVLFFILYPVTGPRPSHLAADGSWTTAFVLWLWKIDPAVNTFPSLHVGHSTMVAAATTHSNRRLGLLAWAIAIGVWISTLTTRQHYIIDLPGGWLVGMLGIMVWRTWLHGLPLRSPYGGTLGQT